VWDKMREMAGKAVQALGDAGTLLLGRGREFVEGASRGISDKFGEIRARAGELREQVKGALSDAGRWLYDLGQDVARGLAEGIRAGVSWVVSEARSMASQAWEAAKSVIRPGSPSRLFRELGETVGPGLAAGILANQRAVLDAISRLLGNLTSILPRLMGDTSVAGFMSAQLSTFGRNAVGQAVGSGVQGADVAVIAEALAAVFNAADWRVDGSDIALVSNRGNLQLARR